MSDAYLNFANSAFGARLAGMLGLPRPVPLERFEAGQPVVAGDVLVGAGGTPELLPALLAAFRAMRAATVAHRSVQGWTAMANQAGLMSGLWSTGEQPGGPLKAVVFDATGLATVAQAEAPKARRLWTERFRDALSEFQFLPAGRILAGAGTGRAVTLFNCFVMGTITDSMDGILDKVHEAGLTLKAGCGIGYEFSTLRPRGAYVSGAGAYTSGPLSFMDIYDKMCFTVSSAGGRRGQHAHGVARACLCGRRGRAVADATPAR